MDEDTCTYLKIILEEQKKTNKLLSDLLDLFKKYEIDEVLYNENLRDD